MKRILIILAVTAAAAVTAAGQEPLSFQGFVRHETALSVSDVSDAQSLTDISIVGKHYIGDYRFFVDIYGAYDTVNGDEGSVELREGYMAADFKDVSFVLGKQWVAWGRADEINPVDMINPEDYSEPLVRDKEDKKIRVPALSVSRYMGDFTLTAVLVPDFTPPGLDANSHWVRGILTQMDSLKLYYAERAVAESVPAYLIEDYVAERLKIEEKGNDIGNSQIGARLSGYVMGTDFSVYYYRGFWSDMSRPVVFMEGLDALSGMPDSVTVAFPPFSMYGFDMEKASGSYTFRVEAAYYQDRYITFDTSRISDSADFADFNEHRGAGLTDVVKFVAGADRFLGDLYINAQYVGEYITDHSRLMALDEAYLHSATLKVSSKFAEDRLEPEIKVMYEITENDMYLSPKVSYELSDGVKLTAAADMFTGDEKGTIGQYKTCDQVRISLKYNF